MTTWYVASAGTNGDGSQGSPWVGFSNINWASVTSGDTLQLSGTFSSQVLTIDSEQDINVVGPAVITGATVQGVLIKGFTSADIRFENLTANATNNDGGTVADGVGFIPNNIGVSAREMGYVSFSACVANDNEKMGFDTQSSGGGYNYSFCVANGNGAISTGGGFFTHPYRVVVSSASLESGTIYSRALDSLLDDPDLVWDNQNSRFLTKTTGTTPADGEFSVDSGNLYFNVGVAYVNNQLQYRRNPAGPWTHTDCVAQNNDSSDTFHGNGIQYDDMTDNGTAKRCLLSENYGPGLRGFRTDGITYEGCLLYKNGNGASNSNPYDLYITASSDADINQTTIFTTTTYGVGFANMQTATLNNCIIKGGDYNIRNQVNATIVANGCCLFGGATGKKLGAVTETGTIESDPLFIDESSDNYRLNSDSPCIRAGTKWWTSQADQPQDQDGLRYPLSAAGKPDIGAYAVREDAGYARKAYAVPAGVLEAGVDIAKARKI